MDDRIQRELIRLSKLYFESFASKGALVFLHDSFGGLLEPAFNSLDRDNRDLNFEAARSTQQTDAADQRSTAGVASIAFEYGRAFSQDPVGDKRLGRGADKLREDYGSSGSMMAVRIGDDDDPFGVIIVYAEKPLSSVNELAALESLEASLGHLNFLLQQRRALIAERDVNRYSELVLSFLDEGIQGQTISQVADGAISRFEQLFDSEHAHICLETPDSEQRHWFPSINSEAADSLNRIVDWRSEAPAVSLNRSQVEPSIYKELNGFGHNLAWCRVTVKGEIGTISCVIPRHIVSFSDHWAPSDVKLLHRAMQLVALRMRRASGFEGLLKSVSESQRDYRQQQFKFWCYLLRDYFGIDQVLVTKVCRKSRHFKIKTQAPFVMGFGVSEECLTEYPKTYEPLSGDEFEPCGIPDAMVRILADFVESRSESYGVYEADCGNPQTERFALDKRIIELCKLKGKILFVPCYTVDDNGKRVLRSILHLGSSAGTLDISVQQHPLLISLGERVAQWLSIEDERESREIIAEIRDKHEASLPAMEEVCKKLIRVTHSLGCTLFLNALHLNLLDDNGPTTEALEDCFLKLLRHYRHWPRLMGEETDRKLVGMFAAFLGLTDSETRIALDSADTSELARILPHVLYVRVSQACSRPNGLESESVQLLEHLYKLLAHRQDIESTEVAQEFGSFLTTNAYLPGFGLTGWVLRYYRRLHLSDKRESTIAKELQEQASYPQEPIWRQLIIEALGYMDVSTTSLLESPFQPPSHANHIAEHCDSTSADSFLAHPIEGFGFSELPAGAIRISGASTMQQVFSVRDDETVALVTRHIANVLRTEHMNQKSYLESVLSQRGDDADFRHMFARLDEGIGYIKERMEENDKRLGIFREQPSYDDDLPSTVARLEELTDKALARDDQRAMALGIRRSRYKKWTLSRFRGQLADWLAAGRLAPELTVVGNTTVEMIDKHAIVYACRTTEEIIRNLRRHQGVDLANVTLHDSVIYAGRNVSPEVLNRCHAWHSYNRLHKKRGGGARVLQDAHLSADVMVEYSIPVEMDETNMVVQIRIPSTVRAYV